MVVEPTAVVREGRGVEDLLAGLQVEEPAEEQVRVGPLAQLAFAPHRIEGHQQKGLQESFRRHAGPTGAAVGLGELRRHSVEDAINATLDVPQRVIRPDPVFDAEHVKQWDLLVRLTSHDCAPPHSIDQRVAQSNRRFNRRFSAAC